MKSQIVAALLLSASLSLMLAACKSETTDGLPATETTGTSQSPSTATSDPSTTAASGGTSSTATPEDKEFVSQAGMAGLAEVQMGNLALQKAQHADVKAYAQRMVTDHTKSNEELVQLTTAKGLTLPAQLDGEPKAGLDHLMALDGAAFDKAYMEHMVADHGKAVSLFQTAANGAQDADIKAFAAKTLPTLQEHATLAGQVGAKVK